MSDAILSDVAQINPPIDFGHDRNAPVSFLPMARVSENGSFSPEVRLYSEVCKGYTPFKAGDVLVAKITPCFENGKAAYVHELPHFAGFASTEFHVLRPGPLLDPNYLFRLVTTENFRKSGARRMTGSAGQQRVPSDFLRTLRIPLPPLEEQKRIAAILDKADAIRRKREQAIQLADDFLRSLFLDMFGDPVRDPKGWPVVPLAQHIDFMTSGSRGWGSHYSEQGSLFLRIQNVGNNRLLLDDITRVVAPTGAEANRTKARPGDLLLSITADLGRTAVVPDNFGEAFINQHLALLRLKNIEPIFLSAYLSSQGGRSQIARKNRAAVKAGLNFDDIRTVLVPNPPSELQRRFATIWARAGQISNRLQANYKVDCLRNSLTLAAFQIRVREMGHRSLK